MVYKWSDGAVLNADAQLVGQELEAIEVKTPKAIVTKAKDSKTELHKCFEWDDSKAAEAYRIEQAGYLVRHLTIVVTGSHIPEKSIKIKAYESVTINDERMYMPIKQCMSDAELREQVIGRLNKDIQSALKTLKDYSYLIADANVINEKLDEALSLLV